MTKRAHPNRLVDETSPYLRQHAYNPVDWFPWGDEALQRARGSDLPILLSIGYSACHWCHVMERESFEAVHAYVCRGSRCSPPADRAPAVQSLVARSWAGAAEEEDGG